MKRLKGISPLVATIMLIAFTLIIAGIISAFVVNFTNTQQMQIKTCTEAKVLLQRAAYDSVSKNLTLTIYNYGRVDLRFETLLSYSNTTEHPGGLVKPNRTVDVAAGRISVFDVVDVTNDLDTVTIRSTRCDSPCYECPGAQDFLRYTDIKGLGYT
ncbi:MAG: type IV pilin [Candidatus Aenigmarchaeota archaeon]|nr:type IV pilin [Candidatus Aenigmarchaeota archaeon]